MAAKDVVDWTLMLTGFPSSRFWNKAREHFNKIMEVQELELDPVALMGMLSSCSLSGAVIDMYANFADLEDAVKLFEGMKVKHIVYWNEFFAVDLFMRMKLSGINPDELTQVCVLCACVHSSVVDQGSRFLIDD
ncbi:unnamed protein product [Ilex paraguariensis]|uniref:Pentatricopeptide repeat-containing protein n=1 Tax=Ilex paraguariensis TaxID=185542 RepID=A0ABC8S0R1_9AQUA